MQSSSNSAQPLAGRKPIHGGYLPPQPTPLLRALREALTAMSDGVRPTLRQPQAFYNAAQLLRTCPTDRLALMIDDCCDALSAADLSAERRLEQALSIPRTLEAHIRARLAPAPQLSAKEHALRVSRVDAMADMALAEHLANPTDPAIAMRAATMAREEAREKLGWADRVQAFLQRSRTA